jgi:hypothetical protein
VNVSTAVALVLALASTVLINLAYLREHDAAATLPVLCIRRPLQSAAFVAVTIGAIFLARPSKRQAQASSG